MMPFHDYDLKTRELLYAAYDAALLETECSRIDPTLEKFTRGLLKAAAAGERDPEKLRIAALRALL